MAIMFFIDGEDLAGKTSVANLFTENNQNQYLVREGKLTRANPFLKWAKYVAKKNTLPLLSEFLYSMAALKDLFSYERCREKEGMVIQVSSMITRGLARQRAQGKKDLFKWEKMLEKFPEPKNAFFLYNNCQKELIERFLKRSREHASTISSDDKIIQRNINEYFRLQEILKDINQKRFNAHIINTKGKNLGQVVQEIREKTT